MNLMYLFLLLSGVNGANILVINIVPTYNHFNLLYRLAEELSKRGNEITMITPYPHNKIQTNIENIFVNRLYEIAQKKFGEVMSEVDAGPIQRAILEYQFGLKFTEDLLTNQNVQKLLSSDKKFDLVLMEHFFDEALVGMGYHFEAPIIFLSSVRSGYRSNFVFANPEPLHYIPNLYRALTKNVGFWQTIQAFFANLSINLIREFIYLPRQKKIFQKFFKTSLDFNDIMYNVSLMLCNSHVVINTALPQVPNLIDIGGYHIQPGKKLPEDLQSYLDEATEGVILFSLGSGMKSRDLHPEMKKSILNTFAKLRQKVIWKFEDALTNVPKNVNIVKWLPQQDILAHPNIRAFITQGGASSLIETVYFGVPVVGVPVFTDQHSNIAEAESNGYAVKVSWLDMTEDIFFKAVHEVIYNPKYRQKVQKLSKLMRDQQSKPIDTAIYWIERVIRFNGDLHLRSAELSLQWYQRKGIDILVFLLSVVVLLVIVIYWIFRKLQELKVKLEVENSNKKYI